MHFYLINLLIILIQYRFFLADQPNSKEICENIYGDEIVIVPYVMPGFDLAKLASELHDEKSKKQRLKIKN